MDLDRGWNNRGLGRVQVRVIGALVDKLSTGLPVQSPVSQESTGRGYRCGVWSSLNLLSKIPYFLPRTFPPQ